MQIIMKLTQTPFGKTYLHIWRDGVDYHAGRGALFETEWTSLRFATLPYPASHPSNYRDVTRGLPYADASFHTVYARRVLEHLTFEEAERFMSEVFRVVKPGGLCRIVVPDLEEISRYYLSSLEQLLSERTGASVLRYRWAVLELVDQMVRLKPGGEMTKAFAAGEFEGALIRERYGDALAMEIEPKLQVLRQRTGRLLGRGGALNPVELAYGIIRRLMRITRRYDPRLTREANISMYDRLLLTLLTESAGFTVLGPTTAEQSAIEGWSRYNFDMSQRGRYPYEPSLYFECAKPKSGGTAPSTQN